MNVAAEESEQPQDGGHHLGQGHHTLFFSLPQAQYFSPWKD